MHLLLHRLLSPSPDHPSLSRSHLHGWDGVRVSGVRVSGFEGEGRTKEKAEKGESQGVDWSGS